MKRRLKMLALALMITCVTILGGIDAEADGITLPDGTVINNNTKWEGLPSSFSADVGYYDALVPYTMKISEIGGQSLGGKDGTSWATSNAMPSGYESNMVGDYINLETNLTGSKVYIGGSYYTLKDDKGIDIAVDNNGNEYYLCALGHYFYPSGCKLGFSLDNRGQAVDVVLTDGTVIHFLIHDAKSDYHTNGGYGPDNKPDDRERDYYKFAPLEKEDNSGNPLGQNLFQARNSEILEIFCSSQGLTEFRNRFNLKADGSGNHIAFIRMYDQKIGTLATSRMAEVGTSSSYKYEGVTFAKGDNSQGMGSSSLALTGSNLVDEWELTGMPSKVDLTSYQTEILLLGRDSLSLTDAETVAIMGSNITLLKEAELLDTVRTSIVFIGLVVLLYGFLMGVAIIFDKANTFIDLSMVNILTFGKLHYDPFEEKTGKLPKDYISTKKLIIMTVIILAVGTLLVSSGMTKLIGRLLYSVTNYLA